MFTFLVQLLYDLWTDADFESDFQRDWFAVYQFLQDGKFDEIPDAVYQMIEKWYEDYKRGL